MSFLAEITTRSRSLKPVQTRITHPDGKVFIETFGRTTEDLKSAHSGEFFIIDTKPDDGLHQVIPRLFIGSQDAASNFNGLIHNGITHILSAGGAITTKFDRLTYKHLPIYDVPEFDIKNYFSEAKMFINDGLKTGSVLVHCNAGISRSSTILTAYIMKEQGKSLATALELVKEARPIAKPNPGFMKQLQLLEKELLDSNGRVT